MPKETTTSGIVYQLRITLRGIRPPVWRRVLVSGDFSLGKLHRVIQVSFGWQGYHLHHFDVDGEYFGEPGPDDWERIHDERRIKLGNVASVPKVKFKYLYDFGDGWDHDILVEKILAPEEGGIYPVCVTGRRACPPEDVGGIWGYADFLDAIRDPKHDEHQTMVDWVGGEFDPEKFDLAATNLLLKRVK
ncbi:MAG: plasmid pRiA4b ORF-3 family protein [Blastocatellia bacterium]|jgi:hypothetical protein